MYNRTLHIILPFPPSSSMTQLLIQGFRLLIKDFSLVMCLEQPLESINLPLQLLHRGVSNIRMMISTNSLPPINHLGGIIDGLILHINLNMRNASLSKKLILNLSQKPWLSLHIPYTKPVTIRENGSSFSTIVTSPLCFKIWMISLICIYRPECWRLILEYLFFRFDKRDKHSLLK